MNKLDYIYKRLCDKYGYERIAIKKKMIQYIEVDDKNSFNIIGEGIGPFYFILINEEKEIDLEQEAKTGLFSGFSAVQKEVINFTDVEFSEVVSEDDNIEKVINV